MRGSYDGKRLNFSERSWADVIDLRIFCHIFVYSAGGEILESLHKFLMPFLREG